MGKREEKRVRWRRATRASVPGNCFQRYQELQDCGLFLCWMVIGSPGEGERERGDGGRLVRRERENGFDTFPPICGGVPAQRSPTTQIGSTPIFFLLHFQPLVQSRRPGIEQGGCNLQKERTPLTYPLTHSPHCPLTFPTTPDILTTRPPTFIKASRTSWSWVDVSFTGFHRSKHRWKQTYMKIIF